MAVFNDRLIKFPKINNSSCKPGQAGSSTRLGGDVQPPLAALCDVTGVPFGQYPYSGPVPPKPLPIVLGGTRTSVLITDCLKGGQVDAM